MVKDIRIKTSFKDHRKRKKGNMILGLQKSITDYVLDLWLATAENHPDGILDGMDEINIALEAGWEGNANQFIEALIVSGFLEKNGSGIFKIHDWDEHQPWVIGSKERSERARRAALIKHHGCEPDADGMPDACDPQTTRTAPSPSPSPSPKPIDTPNGVSSPDASGDSPDPPKIPQCPQGEIKALYHEILCPPLAPVNEWSPELAKILRNMWREKPERWELTWWEKYFRFVKASDFLMGRKTDFIADLEWIIRPRNRTKILNGRFHNRGSPELKKFAGILEWLRVQEEKA